MKFAPFRYHAPASLDEAVQLLGQLGDDAKVLAGGQSLFPLMAMRLARPSDLVDVGAIAELASVAVGQTGGLVLGATVRQRHVEHDRAVAAACPLLAEALPLVGHAAIRNRGTIGGSLSHADPAAELPLVALALDATFTAVSVRGARTIDADDFFAMPFTTALESDEILVDVRLPNSNAGTGSAFVEVARRHGDFPLASVAAVMTIDDRGVVTSAGVGCGGVAGTPVRCPDAERVLVGATAGDGAWDAAAAAVINMLSPTDDIHATADYRRHVAGALVRRALATASTRAGGGQP